MLSSPNSEPVVVPTRSSPLPMSFGRFELRAIVSANRWGVIFDASDTEKNGEQRAVGVLDPVLMNVPGLASTFVRCAHQAARRDHPSLVRVHDAGVQNQLAYVASEWLQGWDLHVIQRRCRSASKPLQARHVLTLGILAGEALDCLHRPINDAPNGTYHGRVAFDKLFIQEDGSFRLIGIGFPDVGGDLWPLPDDSEHYAFLAPEQLGEGMVDNRADVYSLCVLMTTLYTGHNPFQRPSIAKTAAAIMAGDVKTLSGGKRLPPAVDMVLRSGMVVDPSQRPASMRDLLQSLRPLLDEMGGPVSQAEWKACLQALFCNEGPRSEGLREMELQERAARVITSLARLTPAPPVLVSVPRLETAALVLPPPTSLNETVVAPHLAPPVVAAPVAAPAVAPVAAPVSAPVASPRAAAARPPQKSSLPLVLGLAGLVGIVAATAIAAVVLFPSGEPDAPPVAEAPLAAAPEPALPEAVAADVAPPVEPPPVEAVEDAVVDAAPVSAPIVKPEPAKPAPVVKPEPAKPTPVVKPEPVAVAARPVAAPAPRPSEPVKTPVAAPPPVAVVAVPTSAPEASRAAVAAPVLSAPSAETFLDDLSVDVTGDKVVVTGVLSGKSIRPFHYLDQQPGAAGSTRYVVKLKGAASKAGISRMPVASHGVRSVTIKQDGQGVVLVIDCDCSDENPVRFSQSGTSFQLSIPASK